MSGLRERAPFKERLDQIIREFTEPATAKRVFAGAQEAEPLEHVTRRHFIDHFLEALGWDLTSLNEQTIEEARVQGETTLRLDYLGINQATRVPLMIVEAKAWAVPFVEASERGMKFGTKVRNSHVALLCAGIEHCKAGGTVQDSPVTVEWAKALAKLHQYVTTLHSQSGHIVRRLATTSGQWLITFTDPEATFINPGKVSHQSLGVFDRDLVGSSDEIYEHLARSSLDATPPSRIRPTLLHAYARFGDIARVFRALWVSRRTGGSQVFDAHPQLNFYVALVIQRRDGVLLTVIDEMPRRHTLPHGYGNIRGHISELAASADVLLSTLNAELGANLALAPVEEFPGFRPIGIGVDTEPLPAERPVDLVKAYREPGEFLLVTGGDSHFLRPEPTIDPCGFHEWSFCHSHRQNQGVGPVVTRAVTPKSFFVTGEVHHCANRTIHDRRRERCHIDPFEEFLCCRACVLQSHCWREDELAQLPCGAAAT